MRLSHRLVGAVVALLLAPVLLAQVREVDTGERAYQRYAVAADHPLASEAGAEVLAAGGNAADAAAATMLALGVVSPGSSGLGGGGFALYYRASDRSLHYLDFREEAPGAATADMFARREGDDDETAANRSRFGGLAVGIPGEPAGIEMLLERFGSGRVTRAQVVDPALRHARAGFETSSTFERLTRWVGRTLSSDPVFGPHFAGDRIPAGTRITNPAHARSLELFAEHGAEAFYRGAVAREIVRRVREEGGVITAADLAGYEVSAREPLQGTFFGHRWVSSPPPSAGGVTMLASLALLERWLPSSARSNDSAYFRHALAESWKGPYVDRPQYLGDPDHVDVPIDALLASERARVRARAFHPMLARAAERYEVPLPGRESRPAQAGGDAGTSHFCVVDAEGNVAAVTTTVNLPFGAGFTAAGIVMNDEMDDFAREVGEPNAFGLVGGAPNLPGPGRRPLSSMSPTLVLDEEGRPILCAGAAGGSRIITATEQVLLFQLLFGDTPGEALARRRVHHQAIPRALRYEAGASEELLAGLRARGHELESVDHSAVVQTIRIVRDGETVRLIAASDPRKGGRPAGR